MAGYDMLRPWQPTPEQPSGWEASGQRSLEDMVKQRQQGNIRQRKGKLADFMNVLRMLRLMQQAAPPQQENAPGFGGMMGQ